VNKLQNLTKYIYKRFKKNKKLTLKTRFAIILRRKARASTHLLHLITFYNAPTFKGVDRNIVQGVTLD
jgi:hypothetical protein